MADVIGKAVSFDGDKLYPMDNTVMGFCCYQSRVFAPEFIYFAVKVKINGNTIFCSSCFKLFDCLFGKNFPDDRIVIVNEDIGISLAEITVLFRVLKRL